MLDFQFGDTSGASSARVDSRSNTWTRTDARSALTGEERRNVGAANGNGASG